MRGKTKSKIFSPFLIFPILFSFGSFAFVPPGDNNYLILEEKRFRIIFDKQYLPAIDTINRKIKVHLTNMSKFQNRDLDERLTVILISSKTQISNALATIYPSPTISLYPVGIIGLNQLSLPVWFDGVFEHELNHIFQMSRSKSPKILRTLLRSPSLLFFYMYNPYPNIFLPLFILEGDSVLKESLFHYGGRLYNGYARALVYSQLQHHRHRPDRFMKKNLLTLQRTPHSGSEKYLHGGYFMALLAEVYSHKTINSFFKVDNKKFPKKIRNQIKNTPAKEFLSPLFAEHFSFRNISLFLPNLTKVYFNRYLKEASRQKSSYEPVLFESAACPAFGAKGEEIFFMTSDFQSVPILRIFNKKTKKWTSEKSDLPVDKVFKINGGYYARSVREVKPHTIHYSLFSKGLRNNKRFDSMYVQDLWRDKVLYIDPKNNLNGFKLHLNSSFLSYTHSNARFDKNGNVWFFKQKGPRRVLYKNKQPVFSYTGYYGDVLDIEADGTVYFTGSSPYGSSVYQYKKGRVLRSLSSDTVIQAKPISNREFIACEVTPFGYEYKIIPKKVSREGPILYKYKFKKRKPLRTAENREGISANGLFPEKSPRAEIERQISSSTQKRQRFEATPKYKKYFPLKHIRYKGGGLQAIAGGTTNILTANLLFSDYLLRHTFILGYGTIFPLFSLKDSLHLAGLNYQNHIHHLEWKLGYQISLFPADGKDDPDKKSVLNTTHTGFMQMNYPLFKKGRWFSSISSLKMMRRDGKSSKNPGTKGLWRGRINQGYLQAFPNNYAANKSSVFSVFFDNRYDFVRDLNGFKSGAVWDLGFHIGREFYLFPSVSYTRSFQPEVNPAQISLYKFGLKDSDTKSSSMFFHSSDPHRSRFEDSGSVGFVTGDIFEYQFKSRYKAKGIGAVSLGLKKALNISLAGWESRLAPLARIKWLVLENPMGYDTKMDSWNNIISPGEGPLSKDISTEEIQKLVGLSEKEKEEKTEQPEQYLQWLEWTLGFESELMASGRVRIILGFAFGFRTPLKFWKDGDSSVKDSPKSDSSPIAVGGRLDDIGKTAFEKTVPSAFTNLYFKMPL